MFKIVRLTLLLALIAMCVLVQAADAPFSGRIAVSLAGALSYPFGVKQVPEKSLNVNAESTKNTFSDVWGECSRYNKSMHLGAISVKEITATRMQFTIDMTINGDAWIKGGTAQYIVDVTRKDGVLTGTYTGTNEGVTGKCDVTGKVEGIELPPQEIDPNWKPIEIGEHPRMLFRKSTLPELKKKMATPFGKALTDMMKNSGDPVALGMMYQLTGDKSYADRAIDATQRVMDDRDGGAFALGRFWGYRTVLVGNAYDLCYDAWPIDFKERVENYLDWIIYKCIYRGHRVGTVNWAPGSNYTMVIQPGNATGAIALWGEKGGKPLEPLAPRMDIPRLTPLVDAPAAGVPVVTLEDNKIPTEWLLAGPFEQRVNQHVTPYYDYQDVDCLASVGGEAKVKPVPGMKVQFKNQTIEWKSISAAKDPKLFFSRFDASKSKVILDSSAVPGSRENMHIYYYTEVLVNDPGYYEVPLTFYEGRCFINGTRLLNGDIVYLDKGRYSVLLPVAMADGEYTASFTMRKTTEEKATAYYADPTRQTTFEKNKKAYDAALATWEANGERNQQWISNADMLRHLNYMNIQYGMGDGGFQGEGEGYTLECAAVEHDFAVQYQNAFGRSITGRPDISHFAPRYVMTTIWDTANNNKGIDRPINQTYGRGGGMTISGRYFTRSIALCPKEWQPALLWFWMKREGTTIDEVCTEAGAKKLFGKGEYDAMSRVQAFINFPLDVDAKSPDTIMPHTWYASGKGLCVFRDNWNDNVSTVAQIYAKQGMSNGWNQSEAGCFQIRGLGHEWAYKNNDGLGKTGTRWFDNVVILPEDDMETGENMQVTKFVGDEKTGSGAVSIDMDKMLRSKGADIHGVRSFAADYGVEGTPAVFALVDHITGGKSKVWNFQLPREAGNKLSVDGNTFSITNGDITFKATFVGDKDVKIATKTVDVSADAHAGTKAFATSLQATSADGKGGDFFVVMTLQKGTAAEVKTEGEGLNSKVTVAGRTITFDGTILKITK